ncbi:hypothetical protein KY290_025066 [Solanum tuberosum]|uniref:Uncharacterized protein n=1 Tax=Solanum tuberosum TaxID=4113 RepID=A0ABQ7USL1_SOLTU|nr:hypothetical protein KY290_025066 [Solanum tuberosum]
MTLWGNSAEIEGQMLQTFESDKPVLAFCNVKSSIYQVSTTPISSLLISPQFGKANNLQQWNVNMKAQKINIILMLSGLMQTVLQDMYYKFNATVYGIDNNMDPWYYACKKWHRTEDIDYEERYQLKIDVTAKDQFLRITMFDATQYYLGCDVKDYVHSTSEKIDCNFPNVEINMNVIAMEIHEVPKKFVADETKVETTIKIQSSQKIKKLRENEKMKGIAT